MRPTTFALSIVLLITGCSPGNFFSNPATSTSISLAMIANYHAYGDSITYGSALADPATQNYPALLAAAASLPHTDYGVPGDESCDVPNRIFAAGDSPTLQSQTLYTLLISTNDADFKGAGAYETVFNLCQQAAIAWLALPAELKTLATSGTVTTSGPTHSDTMFASLATDAANATIVFPLSLAVTRPVYLWYTVTDGSAGTFTASLDGAVRGSIASSTSPAIATVNGSARSLALLRIPSVPAGTHTLALTQTSIGASGMDILGVGVPPAQPPASMPRLLVGTTPRQLIGSGAPCDVYSAICAAYIADITANVALLQADGLNITLFTSAKYMSGTSADMADSVHPNPRGHQEIFHAIADVLP
jgi:lysophospholipase L1-like esterase